MWRVRGGVERILVLGPDRVEQALVRRGVIQPNSVTTRLVAADALAPSPGELLAAVRAAWPEPAANSHNRSEDHAPVRVVVSDPWLHWLVMPWSEQLLRADSARALFHVQFSAAFDSLASDYVYRADDVAYGRPRAVAALARECLDGLQAIAQERGAKLASVVPLSIAAWGALRTRIAEHAYALSLVDHGFLTLLVVHDGQIHTVSTQRWSGSWSAELERAWRRLRLREPGLALVEKLLVLNLSGKVSGAPELPAGIQLVDLPVITESRTLALVARAPKAARLDFADAAAPIQGWRRAALAAGVLLALAASGLAWREQARVTALEQQLAQAMPSARSTGRPRSVRDLRDQEQKVRMVNAAIRQLNVPIRGLLRSVQPPAEVQTALLGLDVKSGESSSNQNSLKIAAEAGTGSDMTAYVAYLAANRQFDGVYLTKHEIVERPDQPFRFTVEATWRE